jgi:hypothetical protein
VLGGQVTVKMPISLAAVSFQLVGHRGGGTKDPELRRRHRYSYHSYLSHDQREGRFL